MKDPVDIRHVVAALDASLSHVNTLKIDSRFDFAVIPLVRLSPLAGSSASVRFAFGVLDGSSSVPSLSLPLMYLCGGLKVSVLRLSRSPPFAVRSSRISFGGGSFLWTRVMAYALLCISRNALWSLLDNVR